MFHIATSRRRLLVRVGLGLGTTLAATVALPGVAQAHVEIQPGQVAGGDFAVIAFRVPNERDAASTVGMRVLLPKSQPIGSVQTTAMPGWKVTTTTRKLAQPIDVEGEQLSRVVSQVTWTATGGGIRPGQYQDFDLSLGVLPTSGTLVFNAVQTYSDGAKVSWNEVSADESVEAEHPAPTLTLTSGAPQAAPTAAPTAAAAATPADQSATSTTATEGGSKGSALAIAVSAAALVVSLVTGLLVWRRGRPGRDLEAAGATSPLEDTRI